MNAPNLDQIRDIRVTFNENDLIYYNNDSSDTSIISSDSSSSRRSSSSSSSKSNSNRGRLDKLNDTDKKSNQIDVNLTLNIETHHLDKCQENKDEEIPSVYKIFNDTLIDRCNDTSVNGIPTAYKTDKLCIYIMYIVVFMAGFGTCVYCNF